MEPQTRHSPASIHRRAERLFQRCPRGRDAHPKPIISRVRLITSVDRTSYQPIWSRAWTTAGGREWPSTGKGRFAPFAETHCSPAADHFSESHSSIGKESDDWCLFSLEWMSQATTLSAYDEHRSIIDVAAPDEPDRPERADRVQRCPGLSVCHHDATSMPIFARQAAPPTARSNDWNKSVQERWWVTSRTPGPA